MSRKCASKHSGYVKPEKFKSVLPHLTPKNLHQEQALDALDSGKQAIMLLGSAGCGKSLIAGFYAAKKLALGDIQRVYLLRPAVTLGKSIGMLPGTLEDKLMPYFAQTIDHLCSFLGQGNVEAFLKSGKIEMGAVEYVRGRSFENCVVIVEEAQNFDITETNTMLTRIGDNCVMIFTGDQSQKDIKASCGVLEFVKIRDRMLATHPVYLDKDDIAALDDCIAVINFEPKDVVRSGLCKAIVKTFHYN